MSRVHIIRRGERVLFKTRNSSRVWRTDTFIEDFVFMSREAAVVLVERSVRVVGIDAEGGLEKIPPYVEDTGEVNWLITDAIHMEVPVPVISQAVMQLFTSRYDKKYWARAIAMMRHGFGGHPYGADQSIVRERREGRVGDFLRE